MKILKKAAIVLAVSAVVASPAVAGWKLMAGGQTSQIGTMKVIPATDWNQASGRPGKLGVLWTKDGLGLNGLELFANVPTGQPLYRERSAKQNPMPKYDSGMLAPELVEFFERSFRVQNQVSDFKVEEIRSVFLGGHKGVEVYYRYSLPNDELKRRGVARLATLGRQLFVGNFYAPELHYYAAGLVEAQALMETAHF